MIFMGQATAASNDVCQIMSPDQNSHMMRDTVTSMPQEMGHHISDMSSETPTDTADCCPQDCICPLGDCASVMLLSFPTHGLEMVALQKNSKTLFLVTTQFPTALFRPPISL